MLINGATIDKTKLYSKESLIAHLRENGESDRALSAIREYYFETFGNELIWRYPISDGMHAGVEIAAVKEGFVSLPYDCMDKTEYEIFELDRITLFNEEAIEVFMADWKSFSDDLLSVLNDMLRIIQDCKPQV